MWVSLIVGILIGYQVGNLDLGCLWEMNWRVRHWHKWGLVVYLGAASYLLLVLIPMLRLVRSKVSYVIPNQKTISARKELKRRGSWPLAYSPNIHLRYKH